MTRAPLPHNYLQYEPPQDDPNAPPEEWTLVGRGQARIVRNPKRARLLRRRGVDLMDTGERTRRGHRVFFWFVE